MNDLAQAFNKAIQKYADDNNISFSEAKREFVRSYSERGRKIRMGSSPSEYDPKKDLSHPMYGWKPSIRVLE